MGIVQAIVKVPQELPRINSNDFAGISIVARLLVAELPVAAEASRNATGMSMVNVSLRTIVVPVG